MLCAQVHDLNLNGEWQIGTDRHYTSITIVPSIATDPSQINEGKLWYKRIIQLPKGNWTRATLVLNGARFSPEIYVNGEKVSQKNGGMTRTCFLLNHKDVMPNKSITLEIALTSLRDLSPNDASYIPKADQWRSNVSSSLWDDVYIHFHNDKYIQRLVPYYDIDKKTIDIHFEFESFSNSKTIIDYQADIYDLNGKLLLSKQGKCSNRKTNIHFDYAGILTEWSPDNPRLYQLKVELKRGKNIIDSQLQNVGIKSFVVKDKQFFLNGKLCKLRGGSVAWHRWVRSEEGRELAYDTIWFAENIIKRLKDHGANYIRFHLGVPPQRLLDLCDKYGLLVQYEWSFFHGMPATYESLLEQFPAWFDVAMQHPSIAIFHPYNETEGNQLKIVWKAIENILPNYPNLVLKDKDVIHIHKYWWSLFENVGIYYDDASQFSKAIMVDEFGGNYLDENGNIGGYPSLKESFLRFLGRNNTSEERLAFQAITNARIGEYWRRINAAGIAPFVIASSWEDGNTWFMGKLADGNPKPVWNALTALYSPRSVSLDIWDRNFIPNQSVMIPLFFFNDTESDTILTSKISIEDKWGKIYNENFIKTDIKAFEQKSLPVKLCLPAKEGEFTIKAELQNRPSTVKYRIVSAWDMRTLIAKIPEKLKQISVAVPEEEIELKRMLFHKGIDIKPLTDKDVKVLIASLATWQNLSKGDTLTQKMIEYAIESRISVVLLDVGDRKLGQGYPEKEGDLGNLEGLSKITNPQINKYEIIKGLKLICTEAPEPESHLHASAENNELWYNLPKESTWLWNGLRGGLIVPATYIEITGLSPDAYCEQWKARGAEVEKIKGSNYFAYELEGFYMFSSSDKDTETEKKLRSYVSFLVEDAPSLASNINSLAPIHITNLSTEYKECKDGRAKKIIVLANAGKNLTRTPVLKVDFGEGKGEMLISQLLTAGRLSPEFGETTKYGIRYDEVAVQMVLNMINTVIK